ncbi:MAG: DUF5752 family protein [Patescibacteria group bacterium]|nr:DUF5752 family protein [Patescibacteria group bacterium]
MKKNEKKKLINAQDETCFWVCDGSVLRNIKDLKDSLLKMSKKSFTYHVNKEKNDFVEWTKNTLKDSVLANKLSKTKTLKTTIKAVEDALKKYNL